LHSIVELKNLSAAPRNSLAALMEQTRSSELFKMEIIYILNTSVGGAAAEAAGRIPYQSLEGSLPMVSSHSKLCFAAPATRDLHTKLALYATVSVFEKVIPVTG
jgi:hypothetical protein